MNEEELVQPETACQKSLSPANEVQVPFQSEGILPRPSRKKYLFLIGGGVIFVLIIGVLLYFYLFGLKKGETHLSLWSKLEAGKTTKQEAIKTLGKPLSEKKLPVGNALLYPSDNEVFPHTVVFDEGGKVSSIFVQVAVDEQMKFSGWIKKYGQPEKEMYNSYSQFTKTYIFPLKGVAVVASKEADLIYAIQYYKPTSLQDYLSQWGEFLSEENPYQL